MTSRKSNRSTVTSHTALHMEWDRISCPICMEQPHNAVLLKCSSYKNGCRCYICNTSHRHSNCLDRFRKMNGDSKVRASHSTYSVFSNSNIRTVQPRAHYSMISRRSRSPIFERTDGTEGYRSSVNSGQNPGGIDGSDSEAGNIQESTNSTPVGEGSIVTGAYHDVMQNSAEMMCPLCRGSVSGWTPATDVREYLDKKFRACSHDSCKFVGTYEQLREHARTVHLLTKPAHVEHSRKRTWDRLEREQEFGDVISAIRSQIPGAIIVGDYVIEARDAMSPDIDSDVDGSGVWSPVNHVEFPDNRFGSPFSNETLRSSSIWPDEMNRLTRLVPQNRGSLRRSFRDRHSFRSGWLSVRRPSTQSILRRGFSTRHSGHGSSYHGYRRMLLDRSYAGNRNASTSRNLGDSSRGSSRRQRLRYAPRSQY